MLVIRLSNLISKGDTMSLGTRKLIVIGVIGCVFLAANVMVIANWMNEQGIPSRADWIRNEFLTGTAITVILALLVLLVSPRDAGRGAGWSKRCPVCDHNLTGQVNYCGECGSKV
jgi:hypothetical protein